MPFTFMGSLSPEDGKTVFYLAQGEKAYAVTEGEVVNNAYRVNGLKGTQLSFTYLPLNMDQMLAMPAATGANLVSGGSSPGGVLRPGRAAPAQPADASTAAAPPPAAVPAVPATAPGIVPPQAAAPAPAPAPAPTSDSVTFTAPPTFGATPSAPAAPGNPPPVTRRARPVPAPAPAGEGGETAE